MRRCAAALPVGVADCAQQNTRQGGARPGTTDVTNEPPAGVVLAQGMRQLPGAPSDDFPIFPVRRATYNRRKWIAGRGHVPAFETAQRPPPPLPCRECKPLPRGFTPRGSTAKVTRPAARPSTSMGRRKILICPRIPAISAGRMPVTTIGRRAGSGSIACPFAALISTPRQSPTRSPPDRRPTRNGAGCTARLSLVHFVRGSEDPCHARSGRLSPRPPFNRRRAA